MNTAIFTNENNAPIFNLPAISHNYIEDLIVKHHDVIVNHEDFLQVPPLIGHSFITYSRKILKSKRVFVNNFAINKYAKLILSYSDVSITCKWFIHSEALIQDWVNIGEPDKWFFNDKTQLTATQSCIASQIIVDLPDSLWDMIFN